MKEINRFRKDLIYKLLLDNDRYLESRNIKDLDEDLPAIGTMPYAIANYLAVANDGKFVSSYAIYCKFCRLCKDPMRALRRLYTCKHIRIVKRVERPKNDYPIYYYRIELV